MQQQLTKYIQDTFTQTTCWSGQGRFQPHTFRSVPALNVLMCPWQECNRKMSLKKLLYVAGVQENNEGILQG